MKRIPRLFCFTALLLGLICAGCKGSDSVVGRWQWQKDGKLTLKSEFEIRQDGTVGVVLDQMELDRGSWKMKGNEFQMLLFRMGAPSTSWRFKNDQLIALREDGSENPHSRLVRK